MHDPAVFTVKEFGARFAFSHSSFYRLVREGQLVPVKIGRRTVVTATEARRWLENLPSQSSRTE